MKKLKKKYRRLLEDLAEYLEECLDEDKDGNKENYCYWGHINTKERVIEEVYAKIKIALNSK